MRDLQDECMGCSEKRPAVELIARTMDAELVIDRVTLCVDCAEQDLGGLGSCTVAETCKLDSELGSPPASAN